MSFSAPTILQAKWPVLVKLGATKTCTYQSMLVPGYSGGEVTEGIDVSVPGIEILFDALGSTAAGRFQITLNDGSAVRSIDRVAIFPALDLPVVPRINDLIVDPSLSTWKVKAVSEDPVDAHYELWVRPMGPAS